MFLYKDIYQEIGKWLDSKTMLNARLTCRMLNKLYTITEVRDRQREDRIKQSCDVEEKLKCFKCKNEMLYYDADEDDERDSLIHETDKGDELWSISNFGNGEDNEAYYVCIECERFYMICPSCLENKRRNLCQFRGHCGYDADIYRRLNWVRYSKDEDIPPGIIDRLIRGREEAEQGFMIEEYLDWDKDEDLIEELWKGKNGLMYNVTDSYIFYFEKNGWDINGEEGESVHFWRCLQCGKEYEIN